MAEKLSTTWQIRRIPGRIFSYLMYVSHRNDILIFNSCVNKKMAMPVIGGREVLENIRTKRPFIDDPIIQTIPIIVMGPHLFRSDYQRWRDFGVNDVIPKPIKFRYIRQVLLKCSRRELAPPFHGNMPGPGAGRGVMMRPVWGPMPLRGYQGPRSLL